ncbi:MAG: hypothetical protein HY811_01600 [Planctomycetes bacterium]|nr:hypothetical protein [Planctomycetota bacterium]
MIANNQIEIVSQQQRIKSKLNDWLLEIVQERDTYQAQLSILQEENKSLYWQISQAEAGYLKSVDKIMEQEASSLNRRMEELLDALHWEEKLYGEKQSGIKAEQESLAQEEQRLRKKQKQLHGLESEINEKEEALRKLVQDRHLLDVDIETKLNEKQKLLEAVNYLEKSEQPQCEEKLAKLKKDIEETTIKIDQNRGLLVNTEEEIFALDKKAKKLPKRIQNLEEAISRHESDLQSLVKQSTLMEGQLKTKGVQKKELLDTVKHLEDVEIPQRESMLKELESKVLAQKTENQQFPGKLNLINIQLSAKLSEKQKLLTWIMRLEEEEIPRQENAFTKINGEIEKMQSTLSRQSRLLEETEQETGVLNNKIKDLSAHISTIEEQNIQQISRYKELVRENSILEHQIYAKNIEIKKLSEEIRRLEKEDLLQHEAKVKEAETMIAEKEKIRLGLGVQLESVNNQIAGKLTEKERITEEIKRLREIELPQKEEEIKKLVTVIEHLKNETNEKCAAIDKITRDLPTEKAKLEELEGKERVLAKKLQELSATQKELSELSAQVESNIYQKNAQQAELSRKIIKLESEIRDKKEQLDRVHDSITCMEERKSQQAVSYNKLVSEILLLEAQVRDKSFEAQKLADMVRQIESKELSPQEVKLKALEEEKAIQEGIKKDLVGKLVTLDAQIKTKTDEKQKIQDAVSNFEKKGFTQSQEELNRLKDETKKLSEEAGKNESALSKLEAEITEKADNLQKLQEKESQIKKETLRIKDEQKKLTSMLADLGSAIKEKKALRDELMRKITDWQFKIMSETEKYNQMRSPLALLDEKILQQQLALEGISDDYLQKKRELTRIKPLISLQAWQTIFMVSLVVFMLGMLSLFLWHAFS